MIKHNNLNFATPKYRVKKGSHSKYCIVTIIILSLIIFALAANSIMFSCLYQTNSKTTTVEKNLQSITEEQINFIKDAEKLKNELDTLRSNYKSTLNDLTTYKNQLEKLNNEKKELETDNIELQNTLKKAASVGIVPQNYTKFEGLTLTDTLKKGEYIGKFLGTAYTPSKDECGNNKGITNSGKPIIPGISVAVDTKYWKFGTVFYIKGLGYTIAMDTGSAIKGKYRFDFAVFDKKFAKTLGSNHYDVYLVKAGNGNVEDIKF